MQSKVTLTLRNKELNSILKKLFSKQNRTISRTDILKIQQKRGGEAPPLNPPIYMHTVSYNVCHVQYDIKLGISI